MLKRRIFLTGLCALLPMARNSVAATRAGFLDGSKISFIVPYRPGGGYDEYARLLAPVLEQETGARVDLVNMPGGGGMRGATEVYRAPPDGLHLGIINGTGLVANSLASPDQQIVDIARYSYLGRIAAEPRVLIVNAKGPLRDFQSVATADRAVVCGATGLGGSTYVDAILAGKVLSLKQTIVHGFDNSADIRLALLRGDIDVMWGSLGSAHDGVTAGDFRAILTLAPSADPLLAGTPAVKDVGRDALKDQTILSLYNAWHALTEIGRPIVGPPGIPEDRLTVLREALDRAFASPELIRSAKASHRELNPLSGLESEKLAQQFALIDPVTRSIMASAVRGEI